MVNHERNFNNFEFSDNVYQLSGGLIPEIADQLEIQIGVDPSLDDMQLVMDQVGKNKVLRKNAEITAFSREEMVSLVTRSGLQEAMSRSFTNPNVPVGSDSTDALIIMGGVANWQDRTAAVIHNKAFDLPIYAIAGSRWMDTPTEKVNPNVSAFKESRDYYPHEAAYAAEVILPKLVEAGFTVEPPFWYKSEDGDVLFDKFFEAHPELLDKRLAIVRNANAGMLMAIQMRIAARKANPRFDADRSNPQVLIETDSFPLAETDEQDKDSAHYQKAATALRQVVLTAKKLHEVQQAE